MALARGVGNDHLPDRAPGYLDVLKVDAANRELLAAKDAEIATLRSIIEILRLDLVEALRA